VTDLAAITSVANDAHLDLLGAFHPKATDKTPPGTGTLILLGPQEPGFWAAVTAEPEFRDHAPDPLDRWSERVIGGLARDLDGHALFPFHGPTFLPFIDWARRTGRIWTSPVTLLVHDTQGLMLSIRGAIALSARLALPAPPACPCDSCTDRPCTRACPVAALGTDGYDTDACHGFLYTPGGAKTCLSSGCQVRRACPVSQRYGRVEEQSAYHMAQFHP